MHILELIRRKSRALFPSGRALKIQKASVSHILQPKHIMNETCVDGGNALRCHERIPGTSVKR